MHGARLVSTPAINSIGRAVSGLDESCVDMCVKSTIGLDAEEGCYFGASLFAISASRATATSSSTAPRRGRAHAGHEIVPTRTTPFSESPDPCWFARLQSARGRLRREAVATVRTRLAREPHDRR